MEILAGLVVLGVCVAVLGLYLAYVSEDT